MDIKDILGKLCYYDKRNPHCEFSDKEIEDHKKLRKEKYKNFPEHETCACDNCFYGRTQLANEILILKQRLGEFPENLNP